MKKLASSLFHDRSIATYMHGYYSYTSPFTEKLADYSYIIIVTIAMFTYAAIASYCTYLLSIVIMYNNYY